MPDINSPKKGSTVSTIGREVEQRAAGILKIIVGLIMIGLGVGLLIVNDDLGSNATKETVGIVAFFLAIGGLIFMSIGSYQLRKARFVAWSREAIERDRYANPERIRCPRCGGWCNISDSFCPGCSLPLRIRCSKCQTHNNRESRFCSACGLALDNRLNSSDKTY